jgi:hypothetical protein
MILPFQVQDDLVQRQPLCFMYRDRIGRAQREVGARTVTFFVFESPRDREDGNVVGAGELGPSVIIDFYHNCSWHIFGRILTLILLQYISLAYGRKPEGRRAKLVGA